MVSRTTLALAGGLLSTLLLLLLLWPRESADTEVSSLPAERVAQPTVLALEPSSAPSADRTDVADVPPVPTGPSTKLTMPDSPQEYWKELERLELFNPEDALVYALLGETWYPDEGKAAEARRAKIVTLMVDLGQMAEARERTRAFIEKYPQSPYRPLVQGVTGIHPRPGRPQP